VARPASCPSCDAPVQKALTRVHREVILEREPHLDGNVEIAQDGFAIITSSSRKIEELRRAGVALYQEHICGVTG
jgi:hypothetical protein